jgi:YVTN family beta-propeller protein
MKRRALQIFAAAATVLGLAGCGGSAGPRTKPPPADRASSADRSLQSVGNIPFPVYWKAQDVWVADNHLCADPQTCEALKRVSASANGNVGNTAVENYPTAYPYPYGGIAAAAVPIVDRYDRTGNLWVSQSNKPLEFGPGANGDVAPIRTIFGNQTGLTESNGIAVDRWGQVYVVDQSTNRLAMFKESGLGSNVSPDRVWSNPGLSHLNNPQYVAVDDYDIYVTNYGSNSISVLSIDPSAGNAAVATITGSGTVYPLGLALQ